MSVQADERRSVTTREGELAANRPGPQEEDHRLRRRRTDRAVAGVAGGLADHLGVPVLWVRVAFAVLAGCGGAGILAYGLLWIFVPQESPGQVRAGQTQEISGKERQQAFGILALGIALAVTAGTLSGIVNGWVAAGLAVTLVGAAVVWREADESQRRRWRDAGKGGVRGVVFGGGGTTAIVRVLTGAALVISGIAVFVFRSFALDQVQFALVAVVAALVGVAVLTVPWWLRLVRDLGDERTARIRTEERAEIAAHLHDSVLQTLALIQKQAEAPREVLRLARGQERQLRGWLYGPSGYGKGLAAGADPHKPAPAQLSGAIGTAAGEVEDTFAIKVHHVVVGDHELDDKLRALVQATREAMVNAAKHSGAGEVSVYAEVETGKVTVFVRDRGKGFDPDKVSADRHGLADSIRGRMDRNGGTVRLRSAPDEGTEVQLHMPLETADA